MTVSNGRDTMPGFHILTPNLTPGDAVSQDALGMARALRRHGHRACVYANQRDPSLRHLGEPLGRYRAGPAANPDDVLIYHHCVSWDEGVELYTQTRNRRVLKYHNTTPAYFYAHLDLEYYALCKVGLQQTRELAALPAELYLADSDFNARHLQANGVEKERVCTVPPFHELEELSGLGADPDVLRLFQPDVRNIVFVGRMAPNKGHISLVRIFGHYHNYFDPHSRLFLVGALDPRLEAYTNRVRQAILQAGLQG